MTFDGVLNIALSIVFWPVVSLLKALSVTAPHCNDVLTNGIVEESVVSSTGFGTFCPSSLFLKLTAC